MQAVIWWVYQATKFYHSSIISNYTVIRVNRGIALTEGLILWEKELTITQVPCWFLSIMLGESVDFSLTIAQIRNLISSQINVRAVPSFFSKTRSRTDYHKNWSWLSCITVTTRGSEKSKKTYSPQESRTRATDKMQQATYSDRHNGMVQ